MIDRINAAPRIKDYEMHWGFDPIRQFVRGNEFVRSVRWISGGMFIKFWGGASMHIRHVAKGRYSTSVLEGQLRMATGSSTLKSVGHMIREAGDTEVW